jgi:hypothetical protein
MYESFVEYQNRMIAQFDKMVEDYGFKIIDASRPIESVFADLRGQMSDVVYNGHGASAETVGRLNGRVTENIQPAESAEEDPARITPGS